LNKQLYYVLGTSYIDLKQNEKAEEALNKAIEIDPNYSEAQYQLGAHLVNWAGDLQTEASNLNYKDPKVAELDKKANEILLRGSQVLEKYVEKNPNEKTVLEILYKTYYRLGDTEKAAQFKKRADAIESSYPEPPYGTPSNTTKYDSGDVKSISYFYNCRNNKYVTVIYTKTGKNSNWEKSEVESSPCKN
jgi:tetratricopeptide (TPR) repeat protein